MPEYSKKKLTKACEILKLISENPNISIDELRKALDVTDRTIARYISELKNKGIIEREGPDNGGKWKILQAITCGRKLWRLLYGKINWLKY